MSRIDLPQTLTTSDIAIRLAVSADKVRAWIATGELPAINIAANQNGERSRWRISAEDLAAFERRRSNNKQAAKAKPRRKRRSATGSTIEFFK